ncbi:MAG: DUF3243 family protein [Candidatus Methanohalarchaeum thermophilum]|uniref:DUF3243 family protein n=1 Tax=Methanohalarchaeum thermophilum TaxID=1903181 RepID=A0A1Q6DVE3_METT1|nr:MAG: DUF3243 family protein [Candidatus Methanohalarchaeum thermophilum]
MVEMETKEKCLDALDFMQDWDTYTETLKEGVQVAKEFGLTDEEIEEVSESFADFLSEKVCPATPEEELLKDMWAVADKGERKALTSVFFKMIEKE